MGQGSDSRHYDPIEATGCGDQPWEGALIEEAKAAGKYVLFNGEEHRGQAFQPIAVGL